MSDEPLEIRIEPSEERHYADDDPYDPGGIWWTMPMAYTRCAHCGSEIALPFYADEEPPSDEMMRRIENNFRSYLFDHLRAVEASPVDGDVQDVRSEMP